MSYLFATLHEFTPEPGESIAEAWEREQVRLADGNDRAIFATGAIECPPQAGYAGWDLDVIAHYPDQRVVLPPVEDESIVPFPIEESKSMSTESESPVRGVDYLPNGNPVVLVTPGSLVQFMGLGVTINCERNAPEFDEQIYVTVNTEDSTERDMIPGTGEPLISVHLNDATLYDGEEVFKSRKQELVDKLASYGVDVELERCDPEALRAMGIQVPELVDQLLTLMTDTGMGD